MQVIVINLERSPDRRAAIEENLRELSIPYEFYPGIDGSRGIPAKFAQYDRDTCVRRFGAPLTPGEIGCFASHYLVWEECVRRARPVLVMEDDVGLSPAFPNVLKLACERIAEHRLIRLSGLLQRPFRVIEEVDASHQFVRFLAGPSGLQCYALAPDGAAALLAHATSWVDPVDTYVDRFWLHGLSPKAIVPFEARHLGRSMHASLIGERTHRRTGIAKARREFFRSSDVLRRFARNARLRLSRA